MLAETSFKKFVIAESTETGSDQANDGKSFRLLYSRENGSRNTAPRSFMASMYGFPKRVKGDDELSDDDRAELDSLGFNTASEIEDDEVVECEIRYTIKTVWGDHGIDELIFILTYFKILGRYSVWNHEKDDEDWFDFEVEDSSPEGKYRWDSAKEMVPFYPTGIDITMNEGFDPEKFTYDLTLGEWR